MRSSPVHNVFSADVLAVREELLDLDAPVHEWDLGAFAASLHVAEASLWLQVRMGDTVAALRTIQDPLDEPIAVTNVQVDSGIVLIDAASSVAAYRLRVRCHSGAQRATIRCTSSILPVNDLVLAPIARDLFMLPATSAAAPPEGHIYTSQRGLKTGALFGSVNSPASFSFLYLQNFSSLAAYFEQTDTTPADAVGGTWPEVGFRLPVNPSCELLASNEYVTSDACLSLKAKAPKDSGVAAEEYLDALADTLRMLEAPDVSFHFWPSKAAATVFALAQSPQCGREVNGYWYLNPYVDDTTKPPESMVQLTVLVALREYEAWSGERLSLANDLQANLVTFFDEEIGCVVRWLPGARFTRREDEHQTHEAMDSWYLYHVLFNVMRLARAGDSVARELLERSLPFAVRVATRFAYRWPIFFNLKTLDIIQAEASKGSGGENDVSGLYALLMLHAYEIFDDERYLHEAKCAATALEGLGFHVLYQTNTTGFAAEAMLRLAMQTGEERYRKLSHICIANIFENMAIWQRSYGHNRNYSTYFSLYPLKDAPYIAAFEELEAVAKFYEYLRLGGDLVPSSVTFLMCEYARHFLGRGWWYYPSALASDAIASKARNGRVMREVEIPLEDLQDGRQQSGQVGQEIYGAGLAMVCATRHFHRIEGKPLMLFCEYPMYPRTKSRFQVAGDSKLRCQIRLISTAPNVPASEASISIEGSPRRAVHRSPEGHVVCEVHGGDVIAIGAAKSRAQARSRASKGPG